MKIDNRIIETNRNCYKNNHLKSYNDLENGKKTTIDKNDAKEISLGVNRLIDMSNGKKALINLCDNGKISAYICDKDGNRTKVENYNLPSDLRNIKDLKTLDGYITNSFVRESRFDDGSIGLKFDKRCVGGMHGIGSYVMCGYEAYKIASTMTNGSTSMNTLDNQYTKAVLNECKKEEEYKSPNTKIQENSSTYTYRNYETKSYDQMERALKGSFGRRGPF